MTSFLSIISGPPTLTFHKPHLSVIPLTTRHFYTFVQVSSKCSYFSSLKKTPQPTPQNRKEKNILPHPYNKDYSRSRSRESVFVLIFCRLLSLCNTFFHRVHNTFPIGTLQLLPVLFLGDNPDQTETKLQILNTFVYCPLQK